ncbi:hypothetical protein F5X97DRAFT_301983 [Nemania serpens]|nr:hypothetical protein F5X97DRAFT_301983 [Nemania serpens]
MSHNVTPALVSSLSDSVEYRVSDAPDPFIEDYSHGEMYRRFPGIGAVMCTATRPPRSSTASVTCPSGRRSALRASWIGATVSRPWCSRPCTRCSTHMCSRRRWLLRTRVRSKGLFRRRARLPQAAADEG